MPKNRSEWNYVRKLNNRHCACLDIHCNSSALYMGVRLVLLGCGVVALNIIALCLH